MRVNGKTIYLVGIIILCLTILVMRGKMAEDNFISLVTLILGYYLGNMRAIVKRNGNGAKK